MIHGATVRRASAMRTATDTTTIPASHTHAGIATTRARAAAPAGTPATARPGAAIVGPRGSRDDPRLARPRGQLGHVVDADLRRGLRDPPQHRVRDDASSGGLLQGANVAVGGAAEVVLAVNVCARRLAELALVVGRELEGARDRRDRVPVDRHIQN